MSIDEALLEQIKQDSLHQISKEHRDELLELERKIKIEAEKTLQKQIAEVQQSALEISNKKYNDVLAKLKAESDEEKNTNSELRKQLTELMIQVREANKARENNEIELQKRLIEEEKLIREEAEKTAYERERLNIAERDKTISDLKKALDDAQRKASQGSQQLQGEIMELDLETSFIDAFRDDVIEPVAKGTKGGDICQIVKSPRGVICGTIVWEIKRTRNWSDSWLQKLKDDVRAMKANIPVIVSEVVPKHLNQEIGLYEGVWICTPKLAVILGTLLRKSLLDVGPQKMLSQNRDTKADALFTFVTSHEFAQQVEAMIETYKEMNDQVIKERVAYEKFWIQREKQAQRLLLGTANIIGGIQGQIGVSSMPKIKGLELNDQSEIDNIDN